MNSDPVKPEHPANYLFPMVPRELGSVSVLLKPEQPSNADSPIATTFPVRTSEDNLEHL